MSEIDRKIFEVFHFYSSDVSLNEATPDGGIHLEENVVMENVSEAKIEKNQNFNFSLEIDEKLNFFISELLLIKKLTETVESELELKEVSNNTFLLLEIMLKEIEKVGGFELSNVIKLNSIKLMEDTVSLTEFFKQLVALNYSNRTKKCE